jgi:cytosine/uracil/thiamine/allantoin permease
MDNGQQEDPREDDKETIPRTKSTASDSTSTTFYGCLGIVLGPIIGAYIADTHFVANHGSESLGRLVALASGSLAGLVFGGVVGFLLGSAIAAGQVEKTVNRLTSTSTDEKYDTPAILVAGIVFMIFMVALVVLVFPSIRMLFTAQRL